MIKDQGAVVSIYTQIGGDDDKAHKKLHILDARGPREITEMSRMVAGTADAVYEVLFRGRIGSRFGEIAEQGGG